MPLTEEERAEVARLLDAQGDGRKFRDPDFPHDPSSLALDEREKVQGWRRPRKIAEKPQLFVEGVSHKDVAQGTLGDCWFLSAATALAQYPELIRKVIPEDQPLAGKDYHGIIVTRFWRMGEWMSVYIDDKLPVDEDNELFYGRCTSPNEFWLPLLEKAFAKFHGNYEKTVAGFPSEAFLSLTGFVVELLDFEEWPIRNIHRLFRSEIKNNSVIACVTQFEKNRKGLARKHAYTVTGAESLRLDGSLVRLVRVRNPHAKLGDEWEGAWRDSDPNWNEIDGQTLEKLGYEEEHDGQFWMKMSHFHKHFSVVWLAAQLPDFGDKYETSAQQVFVVPHYWKAGINAGGYNPTNPKFFTNPQYTLIIPQTSEAKSEPEENAEDESDGEGNEEQEKKIHDVVIQLIQEQDRSKHEDLNYIGILIFKMKDEAARSLSPGPLEDMEEPEECTRPLMPDSSVVTRARLRPGTYILMPCTREADVSRRFLLRLYSRKPVIFLT